MTPSRSVHWQRVRHLEDILAILERIDDRRRVIRAHLWRQGDLQAAYVEATQMKEDIRLLKEELSTRWGELYSAAQQEDRQWTLSEN
jgi:hypothetical protein